MWEQREKQQEKLGNLPLGSFSGDIRGTHTKANKNQWQFLISLSLSPRRREGVFSSWGRYTHTQTSSSLYQGCCSKNRGKGGGGWQTNRGVAESTGRNVCCPPLCLAMLLGCCLPPLRLGKRFDTQGAAATWMRGGGGLERVRALVIARRLYVDPLTVIKNCPAVWARRL